jgi:hypothetical protein
MWKDGQAEPGVIVCAIHTSLELQQSPLLLLLLLLLPNTSSTYIWSHCIAGTVGCSSRPSPAHVRSITLASS